MPIDVATGVFTASGSTGNQDVTGVGFQPKAVLIYGVRVTATGYGSPGLFDIGFSDASFNGCISVRRESGVPAAGFTEFHNASTSHVLLRDGNATVASFLSDGFRLNWGVAGTTGTRWHYVAFGGATLQAKAGTDFLPAGASGAITGVGFRPECVMLAHQWNLSWNVGADSDNARISFGVATQPTAAGQWSCATYSESGRNPTGCISEIDSGSYYNNTADELQLTSFDSDGWTTQGGVALRFIYLALADTAAGRTFASGVAQQPTATGQQTISGVPFTPGALIAAGTCKATEGSAVADAPYTMGAYDGSDVSCVWSGDLDNQSPNTVSATRDSSSVILSHSTPTATTDAEAVPVAMGAGNFVLDWTTADATARYFGWIAFRTTAGQSGHLLPILGVGT